MFLYSAGAKAFLLKRYRARKRPTPFIPIQEFDLPLSEWAPDPIENPPPGGQAKG